VKPFVVNRRGRLTFPATFFGELDFTVLATLDQFTAVIGRDFEAKAPTGTDLLDRIEADGYDSRYELLRDLAQNLFWVSRYSITMFDKRPTRWHDLPRRRDDVFLPVLTPWEDGERKVEAVHRAYRALPASRHAPVPELEALTRWAMVLHNQYPWPRAHAELRAVGPIGDDEFVIALHPRNRDVTAFLTQEVERPVLLVCVEKFSDKIGAVRTSRMIFGDGAAALLVAPGARTDIELLQTYAGGPDSEVNSIVWPNPEFDTTSPCTDPRSVRWMQRYLDQMLGELAEQPDPDDPDRPLLDSIELDPSIVAPELEPEPEQPSAAPPGPASTSDDVRVAFGE
jgi:3-Oxoacyl-[acyl-carrier-protein (ACP)] synthase III